MSASSRNNKLYNTNKNKIEDEQAEINIFNILDTTEKKCETNKIFLSSIYIY